MSYPYHFSVLPGDSRQEHLIDVLLSKGHRVAYDLPLSDLCESAPIVLASIPFTLDFDELTLTKGQLFFGGCLSEDILISCKERGITAFDYMKDKELAVYNAIATAEGTIAEMIQHSVYNLHGNPVLIFGFGICAKALAMRLAALHMEVCICARNPAARAEAVSSGFDAIPFEDLRGRLPGFLFVVNTVPSPVLTKELLPFIHPECQLFDIASAPGGIDLEAAKSLGLHAKKLPGLPGKYAPKASAAFMAAFVLTQCHSFFNS